MNARELLRRFPNCSRATLQANCGDADPIANRASDQAVDTVTEPVPMTDLMSITIHGQIRGGKNNMIVTSKGKHIPKATWAKWRDEAVADVLSQLPRNWNPISKPTNIRIEYVAGDRLRRDNPAIVDAIFHVLERSGFVEDDTLLWPAQSTRSYDKKNPRATITIIYP